MIARHLPMGLLPWALALVAPATPAAGQQSTLVSFEIEDQFDRVHRETDYAGRIVIIIGSDREGSQFHDGWVSAIRDSLPEGWNEELSILPVADVRGVPFFLKGRIKGNFSKDEDEWILLDWGGELPKAYGFQPNSTNILIFSADGTLVEHVHGRELDAEVLSAILTAVRGQQPDTATTSP